MTSIRCGACGENWELIADESSPCGGILMRRGTAGQGHIGSPVCYIVPHLCTHKELEGRQG